MIELTSEDSQYMYEIIQRIINECGPRMPCSVQEAKAAEIISAELKKSCDNVDIEPFNCQPRAFLGYIKINLILIFLSFILFFMIPFDITHYWEEIIIWVSFILNLVAIIIIWNEFFNYREFIDPIFKKKQSQNVIGTIKPVGERTKLLIFSGHHDSALQFNLLRYLKIGYPIIIFIGLGIMVLWSVTSFIMLLISIIGLFVYRSFFIFNLTLFIIGIPAFIGLFLFISSGEKANKVPGAVDNLSAVVIILTLAKYLKKRKEIIPRNTEIKLISFGCEEAGLRGAYRYVKKHQNELKSLDAECVNLDAIQSKTKISVIDFEPSTRTKHSDIVVKKIKAASKLVNVDISASSLGGSNLLEKIIGQISGGTDATAFSKAGIKAANISAMNLKKIIKFYHQPSDTLDKIEKGSLEQVLKILISFVKNENIMK
ncbi:MAG: M28 family peptidase [Candidatus Heimdallarchaeota archaeon]